MEQKFTISLYGGTMILPVKLEKATVEHDLKKQGKFKELHKGCGGRSGRNTYCKACSMPITSDDIVKGFEVSKDTYVMFSDEDFDRVPLNTLRNIEIDCVVQDDEISSMLYEGNPQFVTPQDEVVAKPFKLFVDALAAKRRVAVGKVTMNRKEQLVTLRPYNGGLVIDTMRFAGEVKNVPVVSGVTFTDKEVDLFSKVVDKMSAPFDHGKYVNEYNEALKKLVEAKQNGIELPQVATPAKQSTANLEEALSKMLED